MVIDYDITQEATGVYNLSFEVWPVSAIPGKPENISGEIMVWIAQDGGLLPIGRTAMVVECAAVCKRG
jgi:hypothetical protein